MSSPHGQGGVFFAWQRASGGFLATTGYDQVVHIYNRHAEAVEFIKLPGMCCCFGWDKDGDLLAVITDKSSNLLIWDANSFRSQWIDTNIRDPLNVLIWGKSSPILAIGSYRGNLMIYNHKTSRRVPIIGKHTKAITCGAWSEGGLLALGSEDRSLSISNTEGDTLRVATLRAEPQDIQFSEMKQDERTAGENTVSLIVGGKTLYLFNLYDPENPIELAFQPKYGDIVAYKWFGDGYILIGFSKGFFVVISTHMKEIGQELFQVKNHKDNLSGIAISTSLGKAASCGENTIKIHELHDLKDTSNVITLDEERSLEHMEWSEDGQLLAVSTSKGNVHVFLSKLPLIGSALHSRVAYLTSLLEVTITSVLEQGQTLTISAEIEPTFVALGPFHLALGMNNRVWFYALGDLTVEFIRDKEYLGTVKDIHLNADYCSVFFDGKVQLHILEGEGNEGDLSEERESKLFPEQGKNYVVSCHSLTQDFLIIGTDMGGISYFFLEDWTTIHDFRHNTGIREIHPEPNGTKVVFIDLKGHGHVYNPVNDDFAIVRDFPDKVQKVLWDNSLTDKDVFLAFDGDHVHTFLVNPDDTEGISCRNLGKTKIPTGQFPILLFSGELSLQTQSGKLVKQVLSTHEISPNISEYSNTELRTILDKNMALGRFRNAWAICQILDKEESWRKLGFEAMKRHEIEFAMRVFRHIGDVGTVWTLEELKYVEDKKLLSGHVTMIQGDYDAAQTLYLQSGSPIEALHMRRDLLHWDQALHLANKLAPQEMPYISKEYAQQLEFTGDYTGSLVHYDKGILPKPSNTDEEEHNAFCKGGIARMSIRCGDVRRGMEICHQLKHRTLMKECAEILESMKQFSDAAQLYEQGHYYDKAAYLYIKLKNWVKIGELLPNISSPKIQLQYAKAKESEGKHKEAVQAYLAARDYDSAVRIYLDYLKDPESAVKIVKETRSTEGAKLVAKFFLKLGDYNSAIQFLVISKCVDEAFQLAQQHGKMNLFAEIIGDEATPEDYNSMALHFESEKNGLQAGRFYYKAGHYSKSLRHLLKVASANAESDGEALNLAIEVVGKSGDNHLSRQLIDFLMGETDGIPKDAKFLFRLYMAKKQYKEAAKTAIIIAREEQSLGNYRNAHDVLFNMYQELLTNNIPVPADMKTNLMILHSYTLARIHIKQGDHLKGARMLLRVAKNISKFPTHTVPILTSTVIECHRSGLFQSAFNYASILMRPEHRNDIDEKYRKKFEGIIRKRPKKDGGESVEEPPKNTPCLFCSNPVPESDLYCPQCKNNLPYCVATGYHVTATDLTTCHHCSFPAFRSELVKRAQNNDPCPMCGNPLEENSLKVMNPSQLKKAKEEPDDSGNDSQVNGDSLNGLDREEGHLLSTSSSGGSNSSSRPSSYRP